MTRILLSLFAILGAFSRLSAADPVPVFDRVPMSARLVLGIKSVDELKAKGNKFLQAVDWEPGIRPSQIFEFLMMHTGLGGAPDPKYGIAFVLVPEDLVVARHGWFGDLQLVALFPFTDAKRLKDQFQLDAKEFKEGQIYTLKATDAALAKFMTIREGYVYIGETAKAVEVIAKSKRMVDELTPEQKKAFAAGDVFLSLHANGVSADKRKEFTRSYADLFLGKDDELADVEFATQFRDACESVKLGLASFQVDDGLSIRLACLFDKNEKTKKFLNSLSTRDSNSDLNGLPEGKLIFGQSVQGDGSKTATFARGFLHTTLHSFETTRELLAQTDHAIYLGVFTEIWKQLKGTRIGLYQNDDPAKHGLLSGVAIVDTDDAGEFIQELRRLAKFSVAEHQKQSPKDEAAEIEKLIRDLADSRFRVRESATAKLMLIGLPAIHYLDRAIKTGDADLVARATKVRESIAATLEARRKEPLSKDSIQPLRPTLGFVEKPTSQEGIDVETMVIRLAREDQAVTKELKQLFGPTWDRVRIAPMGKQAVFLFGSNEDLLRTTVANLKGKKPGLGKASFLPEFIKHSTSGRKMEVHFSIHRISGLLSGDLIRTPKQFEEGTVTSIGFSVKEDYLQFDGWFPLTEFKAYLKASGW